MGLRRYVQETLLRAWKHGVENIAVPMAFLRKTLNNVVFDSWRKQEAQQAAVAAVELSAGRLSE